MRKIQMTISMEPFISRLPSILPAYDIETGGITFFDEYSITERRGKNPSNWGMMPINILLNKKPSSEYNDYKICHCQFDGDNEDTRCNEEEKFVMSFRRLSDWYYFFKEYYNLLKGYGHCSRVYTSAEDYYNYESINDYADQMIYGTDKETYTELDKVFSERGGKVMVYVLSKESGQIELVDIENAHDEYDGDNTTIIDVEDNGFYKWICENIIPSFTIPMTYKDAWKRDTLFYPDVRKWIPWFQKRSAYERVYSSNEDAWECKETDDCCDCEEYFSKGGKRILDLMVEWYEKVNENIKKVNDIVFNADGDMPLACFTPTMILPTSLRNGSEDMGLESIFAPEYKVGIDYRVADGYGATENTLSGTVVTHNGEGQMLVSGTGFLYDEEMMEMYRDEDAFIPFLKVGEDGKYINQLSLASTTKYYTYDENNQYIWSSASTEDKAIEELTRKLGKRYDLIKREMGWLFKDGELLEIMKSEYGIYDERNEYIGGKKFFVFREEGTNTPYTIINGKTIYAEFDFSSSTFYFPFFLTESVVGETTSSNVPNCDKDFDITKYKQFGRVKNNEGGLKYVIFDGLFYAFGEKINDVEYSDVVDSYATTEEGTYYVMKDEIYINLNDSLQKLENNEITLSEDGSYLFKRYTGIVIPIDASHIKGVTRSKLLPLRLTNNLVDDIGNDIDGVYDVQVNNNRYAQPPQMSVMESLYQVGNTANIERYSNTIEDIEYLTGNTNYFVGDIITQMHFFCLDGDGNIIEDKDNKVIVNISGVTKDNYYSTKSSIEKVNTYKEKLNESEDKPFCSLQDGVFCDVVYNIGATLEREDGKLFKLATGNSYHQGVEYTERVCFVKEKREYYTRKPDSTSSTLPKYLSKIINHSSSYPIFVYAMHQVGGVAEMPGENGNIEEVPLANFKVKIGIFDSDSKNSLDNTDIERYNGLQASPTYRDEYRLGQSMIEKVDTDIFIERGLSAAFEKHLKLGEVTSLEALEQMGNGFFTFIND